MTGIIRMRGLAQAGLLLLSYCAGSLGQVELPPLNYEQDALEPYISAEVRRICNLPQGTNFWPFLRLRSRAVPLSVAGEPCAEHRAVVET